MFFLSDLLRKLTNPILDGEGLIVARKTFQKRPSTVRFLNNKIF